MDPSKTWVDHLGRRLHERSIEVTMHNLGFPGATAEDELSGQMSQFFSIFSKKPTSNETRALNPHRTTIFIFLGINDCGRTEVDDLEPIVESVFDALHELYVKAGARNFVLVNVPPIDRSPQALNSGSSNEIEDRVKTWNDLLRTQAIDFGTSSKEATVFLFSSHQVLKEVLENPSEFDFSEDDATTEGGGIWEDDLHLTTGVHGIVAERLFLSLCSR